MSDPYETEEEFHSKDRKQFRKERKHLQQTDRSKFKKSDQAKLSPKTLKDTDLPRGQVAAITGEGIWVDEGDKRYLCSLKGLLKKEKIQTRNLIAVGDFVRFEPASIDEGVVVHIEPRFSALARTDISGQKEQLIAANVDQVLIVISVVEPPLKPALLDRYLIAAEKGRIHPIIVINKVDLLHEYPDEHKRYEELLAAYEPLGFPILSASIQTQAGIEAIRSIMKNKISVIAGQSGVGKSSLLNTAFGFERRTGDLSIKTSKGSHTTTAAELLPLPGGGYCVDTPGVRSFGIWQLERSEISSHFHDIAQYAQHCKFADCTHTTEPQCAVLKALEEGTLPRLRYESYATLLDEVRGGMDNWTKRKMDVTDG